MFIVVHNFGGFGPRFGELIFLLSVRCMMFGFGDDQVPFTESVDLLEDLVVEYITEMVRRQTLYFN